MNKVIIFEQDGIQIPFETTGSSPSSSAEVLGPARSIGEQVTSAAGKSFEQAIAMVGSLADAFANALNGRRVSEAEISLGLKVNVKGDFVIVGSTGEAALTLKLTIDRKETA